MVLFKIIGYLICGIIISYVMRHFVNRPYRDMVENEYVLPIIIIWPIATAIWILISFFGFLSKIEQHIVTLFKKVDTLWIKK